MLGYLVWHPTSSTHALRFISLFQCFCSLVVGFFPLGLLLFQNVINLSSVLLLFSTLVLKKLKHTCDLEKTTFSLFYCILGTASKVSTFLETEFEGERVNICLPSGYIVEALYIYWNYILYLHILVKLLFQLTGNDYISS